MPAEAGQRAAGPSTPAGRSVDRPAPRSGASVAAPVTSSAGAPGPGPGALRVAVVGAGIGGLCLAQGLYRAGVDVTVYERDPSPLVRGQGYRLHIDGDGAAALHRCLPPDAYRRYARLSYRPATTTPRITVLTSRLRRRTVIPLVAAADPTRVSGAVDRQALREILLSGLGRRVRFGAEFTGYAARPDGSVRVRFADGGEADADLLVAADGVGSRVRSQFLPEAVVEDSGTRCVYGITRLTDGTEPLLPAATRHGFTAVVGFPRPYGLALGVMRFPSEPEPEPECGPGPGVGGEPVGRQDYVMWALTVPRRALRVSDPELVVLPPAALLERVQRLTRRWHPDLRALVGRCDVERTAVVPIRVARPISPWPTTNVTLLGDAIHAMSPAGGSGANTALRDAALLGEEILAAQRGERPLLTAVRRYEERMRGYGFAAVARSRRWSVGRGPWRAKGGAIMFSAPPRRHRSSER